MKSIDGKYKIVSKLGEGFGGAVYLVEQGGQRVALKQLLLRADHSCLSPNDILECFKQEFSILKTLNHPHILRILDFGYDAKERIYYFTTEFIEGSDILSATEDLSPLEIEELFVQILRALSHLHRQRIYHLDIKPTNILVTRQADGKLVAKLIDFGLSALKKKGMVAGSPGYIPPEVTLQEPTDGRSDLYSLGVTWYTCLFRRNPFQGKDLRETLALQKMWTPPPLSSPANDIPAYLDPVLEKLMKKKPSDRYHHADQVIRDINWGGNLNYPLETGATALAYLPGEGKMVGRDSEWEQFVAHFERVFLAQSELKCAVAISGPSGSGKSRFLKEIKYHAQLHTIPLVEGRDSLGSGYGNDCLILIDDADANTLKQIEHWIQLFHRHQTMVIVASRNPGVSSGLWHHLHLENFDRTGVAQYFTSVLGVEEAPNTLVEELFVRTEGNPLFLTEMLHSLISSHQLFDDHGRWSAMRLREIGIDFAKLQIPRNISEYCERKYGRLSPAAKKVLATMGVAKVPLSRYDFSKMSWDVAAEDWKQLLDENLVAVDTEGNLSLVNPNFRSWLEKHLPPDDLVGIHQELGEVLEADPLRGESSSFHLGMGKGAPQERVQSLMRYGNTLAEQNHWPEAAQIFEKAVGIAVEADQGVELRLRLVRALFRSGNHGAALKVLEETNSILKRERENPQQWRWVQQTYKEMGSIFIKEGRLDLAHEALEASRVMLEQHADDLQEEMVLANFKSSLLMREGKLHEAMVLSENNFMVWKDWPVESKKSVLNNELASIYLAQGKAAQARSLLDEMRGFFREIGQPQKEANAVYALALCHFNLKQHRDAERLYLECVELSRKIKNEELLFHAFNELGNVAYAEQEWEKASEYYHHALELAQHVAANDSSIAIAINLALVLLQKKDSAGARLYLKHVVDSLETRPSLSLHQLQFLLQGYLALGKLQLDEQKWIEARDAYRDALHVIRSHTALEHFRASALIGMIQGEIHLRRVNEARSLLLELKKEVNTPEERKEMERITENLERILRSKAS